MTEDKKKNIAIGIDLGTTNSLAAVVRNGKPQALAGEHGAIVPSVIHIDGDKLLVGHDARRKLLENPLNTVYSVKRLMGRAASDMTDEQKHLPFTIAADARGLASVKIDDKIYSPMELSAAILSSVKNQAEKALGDKITRAVITVPAYFDDAQRQATRDAGKIAGLEVLRIINEPTAASLAYGLDKMNRGNIAVYDLGGGTFDISILRLENGIFEVLSTAGDTRLGGDDFDNAIIDFIVNQSKTEGITPDLASPLVRAHLKDTAERAKIALSQSDKISMVVPGQDTSSFAVEITREQFEALIADLIAATISSCQRALTDAKLSKDDIGELILVGGSTRIPAVRREVEKFFGHDAHCDLGPDEVVALGAAVQADILTGGRDDLLLLDVTPLSLGLEIMGGVMNVLIPRNSKVPAMAREVFTTYVDGQTSVAIRVFQGEREMVADNRELGRFDLKGITPQHAGVPRIEVTFTLDADGILRVAAVDQKTGKKQDITVRPSYGLDRTEVDRMVRESFIHARKDIDKRLFIELSQEAGKVIAATKRAFEMYDDFKPGEKEDITDAVEELEDALKGTDSQALREKLDDLNHATADLAQRMADAAMTDLLKTKSLLKAKDLVK